MIIKKKQKTECLSLTTWERIRICLKCLDQERIRTFKFIGRKQIRIFGCEFEYSPYNIFQARQRFISHVCMRLYMKYVRYFSKLQIHGK